MWKSLGGVHETGAIRPSSCTCATCTATLLRTQGSNVSFKLIYASRSHLGTILPTLTSEVRHSPRRTLEDEVLRHSNIAANAPHFTRGESQGVLLKNETYQ